MAKIPKDLKTFYDGFFGFLHFSLFYLQSRRSLALFIFLNQTFHRGFCDLFRREVVVSDKNARGNQTFLRGEIESGRQGFVETFTILCI